MLSTSTIIDRQSPILILVFSLPFPNSYINIAIIILGLYFIYEFTETKKFSDFKIFWLFPVLLLYYFISMVISRGQWEELEKRLLLIAIPTVLGFSILSDGTGFRRKISKVFILANLLAAIFCLIRALHRSITLTDGMLSFNSKMIENSPFDFLTSAVQGGNYFFSIEFSWFLHPIYFGLYLVFAQYLCIELIFLEKGKEKKYLWPFVYLFLFVALFFVSSKASIITSILIIFFVPFLLKISFKLKVCLILITLVISLALFNYNPRLKIFKATFFSGLTINPEARFGHDLRILSWDASLDIIKENWLFGVGESNKINSLVAVYNLKGYTVPAEKRFNSHNMYLDFLIGGGVLALGLYLTGLVMIVWKSIKVRDYTLLVFCLIFSFNGLFENLFSRHAGIILFVVFVSLFYYRPKVLSQP